MVPAGKEAADAAMRCAAAHWKRCGESFSSAAGSAALNCPPLCGKSSPPLLRCGKLSRPQREALR